MHGDIKSDAKRWRMLCIVSVLTLIVIVPMLSLSFLSRPTPSLTKNSKHFGVVKLDYPSRFNYRQHTNECGPYAAGAVARVVLHIDIDSQKMVDELPWRLPKGYTHPWALKELLTSMHIESTSYSAKKLSASDKQKFLMQELSNGAPIILLVKMYGYQHYIVLLGFDRNTDEFFVYDPVYTRGEDGYTIDDNGNMPGNRTMHWEDLHTHWSDGGVLGFFNWYMLVASLPAGQAGPQRRL